MAEAGNGTYTARKLVVYLGRPASSAIVEVRSSPDERLVRAEAGDSRLAVWTDGRSSRMSVGRMSVRESEAPNVAMRPQDVSVKYEVRTGTLTALAGVGVVPLELVRRSDGRLVERLWVHPDNGMVYRREIFGEGGRLLGMSTVLDVQWGANEGAAKWSRTTQATRSSQAPGQLPYSYGLVSTHDLVVDGRNVQHWVYSDGLHTLSVFRSRGSLRTPDGYQPVSLSDSTAYAGPGPGTWTWQGGDHTYVVVADEAQLDPAELTEGLDRGAPNRLTRLGAVWAKAYHWLADRV